MDSEDGTPPGAGLEANSKVGTQALEKVSNKLPRRNQDQESVATWQEQALEGAAAAQALERVAGVGQSTDREPEAGVGQSVN